MAGPRQVVDGPSFAALPYGLWDALQQPAQQGPHWQNGITWVDRCPTGDTLYEECIAVTGTGGAPASGQAIKSSNVVQTNRGATSFAVYAEFDCSPVGLTEVERIASDALAKVELYQVEKAFWTGVAGKTSSGGVPQTTVFPHLAANAVLLDPGNSTITLQTAASVAVTGSGDDAAWMLGQLEANLAACYHGQGLIHIPPVVLPTLAAWKLVDSKTSPGQLLTPRGNLIVVGDGYTGSGPDGLAAPAGSAWIYATGAAFGYRSEVMMQRPAPDSFDRIENTYKMIAERAYVIGFECCHLAARLTLGVPT